MSLLDRLSGAEKPKIPVHQFQAAVDLWALGLVTRTNIINEFGLSVAEEGDLDFLKTKFDAALNKQAYIKGLDSLFLLAERKTFGMDVQATFVAAVNQLILIPAA